MDWKSARLYAAAMGWPVILVCGWLGAHFGGGVGAIIGTFVGIAAYFYGLWRALPKEDENHSAGGKKDKEPPPGEGS